MRALNIATDPIPRDATSAIRERAITREQVRHDERVLLEFHGCMPPATLALPTLDDDTVVEWDGELTLFGELEACERKRLVRGCDGVLRGSYPF